MSSTSVRLMRPLRIPWLRRPEFGAAAALLAVALCLPACVTSGTHEEVVAERDGLLLERGDLRAELERLSASNQALEDERLDLIEQTDQLHQTRSRLESEIEVAERDLAMRERQLADSEDLLAQQVARQNQLREAAESELAEIRQNYDALVGDLEHEVEQGRDQLERLREGAAFTLPSEVVFAPGSANPTTAGQGVITKIGQRLAATGQLVEVHGHTDAIPTRGALAARYPTNWELAGARAARVVRILVDSGVDPAKVVAISHGSYEPVAPNDTPDERAENRRIEIRLKPAADGTASAAP
jgi:chemotaxis protein MotB